jgi:hypothetical protein
MITLKDSGAFLPGVTLDKDMVALELVKDVDRKRKRGATCG